MGISGKKWRTNENGELLLDWTTGYPSSDGNATYQVGNREPKFLGGLNNSFTYKNWNLSFLFDFRKGGDILNGTEYQLAYYGLSKNTENRGDKMLLTGVATNPATKQLEQVTREITLDQYYYQNIYAQQTANFVETVNWLRLRSVNLSYDLPSSVFQRVKWIKGANFTLNATNLLLFTNYSGMDPEVSAAGAGVRGSGSVGVDYAGVPNTKSVTFGVNLNSNRMKSKILLFIAIGGALITSCKDWMDVNDNPNNPNTSVPTADLRLPPILAQFVDGYESAGTRGAILSQQLVSANNSANNWNLTQWNITSASINWPYQSWYVYCAVNIPDMLKAAEKAGANHYYGVGKVMWAWGFANLADMYGMVPYDEAFVGGNMTPKYDQGEYIYEKALKELDLGIEYLQKKQNDGAPELSKGDYLYGGDVQKWIKLAYGLKVRMLNHLSKTNKYDPTTILANIEKAPKTTAESAIYQYQDEAVSGNAATNSLQYANNNTNRLSQLYLNYILNTYTGAPKGNNNVEDPRASLLIPNIITNGAQSRTVGVDLSTLSANGFPSSEPKYGALRSSAASTGTWYTTKNAKGLLLTNAEMFFVKSEVYFRQGNKAQALQAYKDGIKAHCDLLGVNSVAFLASSSVVQDVNVLTLSHIMIQKYIALSYSPEMFNDVRRLDYCTDASGAYNEAQGIYKGFIRPGFAYTVAFPTQDLWPRRFNVPTYGIQYNYAQVVAADPDVQNVTYTSKPVFWDKK